MKKALIIHGPSGAGKTTLAREICKKYGYKHCDADEFKFIFSPVRSLERTEIGELISYAYANELVKRGHDVVIEAFPDNRLKPLLRTLSSHHYSIREISLSASVDTCIARDSSRTDRNYGKKLITKLHPKYSCGRGLIVEVSHKTTRQVLREIQSKLLL